MHLVFLIQQLLQLPDSILQLIYLIVTIVIYLYQLIANPIKLTIVLSIHLLRDLTYMRNVYIIPISDRLLQLVNSMLFSSYLSPMLF